MAIKYKYPGLETQVRKASRQVRMILNALDRYVAERFNKDIVVTSVYRKPKLNAEAKTVHSTTPCRGIDVRVNGLWDSIDKQVRVGLHGQAKTLSVDQAEKAVASLNRRYLYDAERPQKTVAVFGELDTGNGHWNHIHLQGHSRTRLVVSQQPEDMLDDVNDVAEDFIMAKSLNLGEAPGKLDGLWARLATNDALVSVARRVGKGISAVGTAYLMAQLGAGPAVTAALIPTYLAVEKGLNKAAENKSGKSTNLDWMSLLFKLLGWIISAVRNRK